jgi:hypothetical protein
MEKDVLKLCGIVGREVGLRAIAMPAGRRADFLKIVLAEYAVPFLELAYSSLQNGCEEHIGRVEWNYFIVSNGAFFVAPIDMPVYQMAGYGNGPEGRLSGEAAGMYATSMALCHLAFHERYSFLSYRYSLLRDYMEHHPEGATLFGILD